ncbi:MAG: SpoIIE family protein phosphatase [Acidimicrobiia bacterium]|nr:SpoIIE family protein phosphatase [Acidimicrobiia bacterium]
MRVHDGRLSGSGDQPACRAVVGGLGVPGLRDLDFGRQVVRYLQHLEWPEAVLIEDLSYAAHLVLHRIQELRPAKVVLVGVVARDGEAPGALRRYRLDVAPPSPELVHQGLSAAVSGMADLDHTLAVVRHWGGLPADTTVIEVQPADCSFGPGFSEELGDCIEPILAMVREELGCGAHDGVIERRLSVDELMGTDPPALSPDGSGPTAAPSGLEQMADHARSHEQLGRLEPYRNTPLVARRDQRCPIRFEVRNRPFGVGLGTGGDWYDVIPKPDGTFAVLLGDAVGRGAEGAAVMTELRSAVRAYALLADDSPRRLLARLDYLIGVIGMGKGSALAYLHVHPQSGRVRMSNAGQCPPLVSDGAGSAFFAGSGAAPLLGATEEEREELDFVIEPGSTLFLFTAGLARSGRRSMAEGLAWVRSAAARGPRPLDDACDFVFNACLDRRPREDDAMVVALRLDRDPAATPPPVPAPSTNNLT